MDKFWATMIIEGKAKFDDIKSEARKRAVKKLLDQYLEDGTIDQFTYNTILNIHSEY